MGRKCIICREFNSKTKPYISLHSFPTEPNRRNMWIKACKLDSNTIPKKLSICSKHFTENDFDEHAWPQRRLAVHAVPAPSNDYFISKVKDVPRRASDTKRFDGRPVFTAVSITEIAPLPSQSDSNKICEASKDIVSYTDLTVKMENNIKSEAVCNDDCTSTSKPACNALYLDVIKEEFNFSNLNVSVKEENEEVDSFYLKPELTIDEFDIKTEIPDAYQYQNINNQEFTLHSDIEPKSFNYCVYDSASKQEVEQVDLKCDFWGDNAFSSKPELINEELDIKTESPDICQDQNINTPEFSLSSDLQNHLNTNSVSEPFNSSGNTSKQENDIQKHVVDKSFQCDICNLKYTRKSSLRRHRQTHSGARPFNCNLCGFKFTEKGTLKQHLLIHSGEKPIKCSICEYRCINNSYLRKHMLFHKGEKAFQCELCPAKFVQNCSLREHMQIHTGEKLINCEICDHTFLRKQSLQRHMITHSGEKPFQCNICKSKFARNNTLKLHLMSHTGEKPVKCTICDYRCRTKSYLIQQHMKIHSREKPFKCSICNYRTAWKNLLKQHTQTHTGEEPFRCNLCDSKFTQKNNLRLHIMTHTGEKPVKCSLCEYSCTHKGNLERHMKIHSMEKTFKRNGCDSKFAQKSMLKEHIESHTGEKTIHITDQNTEEEFKC